MWGAQGRWVPLGGYLTIVKQHKTSFPGPFRIPSNNFVFTFFPPSFFLYILNIKSKHLATKVSQDGILLWFKQWPKGLPGRRRLQQLQVAIFVVPHFICIRLCHFNKIDSLTQSGKFYTCPAQPWTPHNFHSYWYVSSFGFDKCNLTKNCKS